LIIFSGVTIILYFNFNLTITMRRPRLIATILVIILLIASTTILVKRNNSKQNDDSFSFVFMTDIHLEPERNAVAGFTQALDSINSLNPDFVVTGGDQIMDALGQRYSRADSLYKLYSETVKRLDEQVYNCMGNHEIYGIYSSSGADKSDPEYGEKMFEKRMGKSYYSFNHKGWKFMVLNSVEDTGNQGYIGLIDSLQVNWIKEELATTDPATPIVLVTHIPFITAYTQRYAGSTIANGESLVVKNSKEVLDLFNNFNLKLVLQGHLHTVEDIMIEGTHFITGGAISGAWWTGPNRGFQEGFVEVYVNKDDFTWRYVDYGWEPEKEK
jgi:3',5'-cyclic-AMP phosphodiesterase